MVVALIGKPDPQPIAVFADISCSRVQVAMLSIILFRVGKAILPAILKFPFHADFRQEPDLLLRQLAFPFQFPLSFYPVTKILTVPSC